MSTDLTNLATTALCDELDEMHQALRGLAAPLSDKQFWSKPLEPGNSVGHLVLHLTGNLNYFVGGQLGGSGYVRDREREFTETSLPAKDEALQRLHEAVAQFRRVVQGLGAEQLSAPHPEARFGKVLKALLHLVAHFAIHRGQISYISRLVQAEK